MAQDIIKKIKFDRSGLVPVIAQSAKTKEVLMLAWMNKQALRKTLETGEVHYWSRSRRKIWKKGETSGHTQELVELVVDCDADALLVLVKQKGVACHTGRRTCFFSEFRKGKFIEKMKPSINPKEIYNEKDA